VTRYRFSEAARRDLVRLVDYVCEDSGPDRAEALAGAVFQALERLARMPGLGHRREDLTDADLRFWPVSSWLIVYDPNASPLEVVRVLHGARRVL